MLTFGPNEALVVVAVEAASDVAAAALLARAIPNACVVSLPVVPAPEPPATANTMLAITTGSDATTIVLRRRLNAATGGKSFRGIPSPPWVCSLCDDGGGLDPAPLRRKAFRKFVWQNLAWNSCSHSDFD